MASGSTGWVLLICVWLTLVIFRPVFSYDLGVLYAYIFNMQKYEEFKQNMIICISRHVLWFVFQSRICPMCQCPMCKLRVCFCIALCVVLALNSRGWYFCCKIWAFTFFFWWKLCLNYFQNYFHLEQNKMEKKWKNTKISKHFFQSVLLSVFQCKQICIFQGHNNIRILRVVYLCMSFSNQV